MYLHKFSRASGEIESGTLTVYGKLTVLACDYQHIKAGYYISNEADCPFAYKVKRSSVNLIDYIGEPPPESPK